MDWSRTVRENLDEAVANGKTLPLEINRGAPDQIVEMLLPLRPYLNLRWVNAKKAKLDSVTGFNGAPLEPLRQIREAPVERVEG